MQKRNDNKLSQQSFSANAIVLFKEDMHTKMLLLICCEIGIGLKFQSKFDYLLDKLSNIVIDSIVF